MILEMVRQKLAIAVCLVRWGLRLLFELGIVSDAPKPDSGPN